MIYIFHFYYGGDYFNSFELTPINVEPVPSHNLSQKKYLNTKKDFFISRFCFYIAQYKNDKNKE